MGTKQTKALSHDDYLKMAMWIANQEESLLKMHFDTWEDVARYVGNGCKLMLSVGSLKRALKALDIEITTKRGESSPFAVLNKRLDRLETVLGLLLESLGEDDLYAKFGET